MTGNEDHDHRDRCFFCLHPVQNTNSKSTITKQLLFLFRHLNLNVTSATKRLGDFDASFCPGCTNLISDFFNWYQQLELDRMFINSIISQINDVIKATDATITTTSNNNYPDKTDLFGRIRTTLIDKCNQHVKKATPRVTLTRVDVDVEDEGKSLETTIKVNEQLINQPETENCDKHDDDDHSDIDIAQDEPLEDLHAEDDDDDESKIKRTESPPDTENVQIVPGAPDPDPSQYRKPPLVIASSQPWQAPGDIFKDHVTTKYYRSPRGGLQRRYVYTCKLCNAQVYDKPAHRSFHRNETPYECLHCDLGKFTEPTRLRYHLLTHHPEQNFLQFKERTLSMEKFKIAVKMLFEGLKFSKDRKSRLCPHCDQRFGPRGSIIGHMIEKHHSELVVRLDSLQENTELLERREQRQKKIATNSNKKINGFRKPPNDNIKTDTTNKSEPQEEPQLQKPEPNADQDKMENKNPGTLEAESQAQDNQDQMSLLISSILGPEETTDPSTEKLTLHFESREETAGKMTRGQDKGQGQPRPSCSKRKLSAEIDHESEKSWDHFLRRPRKQKFKLMSDEPDIDKNLTLPTSASSSSSELMQCPYCSENGFWQKAVLHGHLVNAHLEQFFIFEKKSTITLDRFKVIVNLLFANIKIHIKYVPNIRGNKKKVGHFHCDYCDSKTSIFRETFKTRSELKGHMIQNHLEQLLERLNELQEKENCVKLEVDVDVAKNQPAPKIVQIDDPEPEQPKMTQAPPLWHKIRGRNGNAQISADFIVRWKVLKYIQNKQGLKQPVYLYFCKLCNKAVRNLSLHRRVHLDDKRYKCGYCENARFIQFTCLAKHISIKHLEKVFETAKFPTDRSDAEFELILERLFRTLSKTKRDCESRGRGHFANDQDHDQGGSRSRSSKICSKFVCIFCDQAISCQQTDLRHHLAFKHYNDVAQRLMKLQRSKQQKQEQKIISVTPATLKVDIDLDLQQEQEQELVSDWKPVPMNFEGDQEEPEESEIVKIERVNGETEQDPLFM